LVKLKKSTIKQLREFIPATFIERVLLIVVLDLIVIYSIKYWFEHSSKWYNLLIIVPGLLLMNCAVEYWVVQQRAKSGHK